MYNLYFVVVNYRQATLTFTRSASQIKIGRFEAKLLEVLSKIYDQKGKNIYKLKPEWLLLKVRPTKHYSQKDRLTQGQTTIKTY